MKTKADKNFRAIRLILYFTFALMMAAVHFRCAAPNAVEADPNPCPVAKRTALPPDGRYTGIDDIAQLHVVEIDRKKSFGQYYHERRVLGDTVVFARGKFTGTVQRMCFGGKCFIYQYVGGTRLQIMRDGKYQPMVTLKRETTSHVKPRPHRPANRCNE